MLAFPARAAGFALVVSQLLSGCDGTARATYPTLEPLDDLLAQADSAFSRPAGE
jgi:hypothetical protein